MVQGAKHMKSNNAAANGGSSPQPKPHQSPNAAASDCRAGPIGSSPSSSSLLAWPYDLAVVLDRLEASGVFNQISTVSSTVDALSAEERERILLQARSFNEQLAGEATELPTDQIEPYAQQLIFDRDPMMSWVEIPSIDVSMPIYHGTSEEVLMAGVGHLEGTSLPVGGTSTHCVLTAHSGMRNLSMFDDIHSLEPGDLVLLHTMNKTLAYKMVNSEVVCLRRWETLTIEPGADKVTLCHLHTLRRERPSPAGALRAHQVQQEGRRQAKVAGRSPLGQARVCCAHRGRGHCAVAAGHRDPRGPQAPQGQGLGIRHSPEPPQWDRHLCGGRGLPNHHNIR